MGIKLIQKLSTTISIRLIFILFLGLSSPSIAKAEKKTAIRIWEKDFAEATTDKKRTKFALKIAQAYASRGKIDVAKFYLEQVIAEEQNRSSIAKLWEQMGNVASKRNSWDKGVDFYEKSISLSPKISTYNNLAILYLKRENRASLQASSAREEGQKQQYDTRSKQFRDRAVSTLMKAESLFQPDQDNVSVVKTLLELSKIQPLTQDQKDTIARRLNLVPASRAKVFQMLYFSKLQTAQVKKDWLDSAEQVATKIRDKNALSFIWLEKAVEAEAEENLNLAEEYAFRVLNTDSILTRATKADLNIYKAYWLLARLTPTEEKEEKLALFEKAISALNSSTKGLDVYDDFRSNFKTVIEPIYRETLELLLDEPQTNQENLAEAIAIYDKLRLAQLQNYFGDDCFEIVNQNKTRNTLNKDTAQIYSIILNDKTFFILELPNGKLIKSEAWFSQDQLLKLANQWTNKLYHRGTIEYREESVFFYDLIIKPFEAELNSAKILIFINDGILRNLPMAALMKGDRFLVEDWAVISSLGRFITPKSPKSTNSTKPEALIFGLSNPPQPDWSPLPEVVTEVAQVQEIIGGESFTEQEFTLEKLTEQLANQNYSTIHLATHGSFGGTAESSFILAYNEKISVLELEKSLLTSRQMIDLLVLSACETATTNELSLLGLAGVSARSGVNSTLATLWGVNDSDQRKIIKAFYSYLKNPQYNEATALQKVQVDEIHKYVNGHPGKWAALTLISNYR